MVGGIWRAPASPAETFAEIAFTKKCSGIDSPWVFCLPIR